MNVSRIGNFLTENLNDPNDGKCLMTSGRACHNTGFTQLIDS